MRAAILQMQSGIDPTANARTVVGAIAEARAGGADMLFTPEMSNLLDRDRSRSEAHLRAEEEDETLSAVRRAAAEPRLPHR
jgi:predicted amidohydrolase